MLRDKSIIQGDLDRVSIKRNDEQWIESCLKEDSALLIPIFDSKILILKETDQSPVFVNPTEVVHISDLLKRTILLGQKHEKTYFALNVEEEETAVNLCKHKNAEFKDLRQVIPFVNAQDYQFLALARFMVYWNQKNQYCGICGIPTRSAEAGNLRICTKDECAEHHFPAMDPAVIVLVSNGDKCLLGSQPGWPKGMYSTIAGFVEPGESAEDAVIREVQEETGIRTKNIIYQSSQPWLFPGSLMLGFTAEALNTEINIEQDELDDARWFTREEIRNNVASGVMRLSSKVSISYELIKTWYEKDNNSKLDF